MSTRVVWRTAPVGSAAVTQPAPSGNSNDEIAVIGGPTAVKPPSTANYTGPLFLAPAHASTIPKT